MIELYESNLLKMTTAQKKAQCVSCFIETKSDVHTQRNYRSKYGRDPPSRPSIRLWHKKFMETGTVFDASLSTFSYEVHPHCCQTIGSTTCNSAQSPTQKFKIVCLQSANATDTSAKRHAKTKRICSKHAPTNF